MSDVKRLLDEASPRPWTWDKRDEHLPQGVRKHANIRCNNDLPWPFGDAAAKRAIVQHESWYVHPRTADLDLIVYAVNHLPDYEAAVDALERVLNVGDALWEDHPPVWMSEADEARAALRRLRGAT